MNLTETGSVEYTDKEIYDEDHVVMSPVKRLESEEAEEKSMKRIIIGVYILLVFFGVVTGYALARKRVTAAGEDTVNVPQKVESDTVAGIMDEETFKDTAVGKIEKGGIDGEGTHKLIRDGGPSQTVYLTSSVVNLDKFVNKQVKIWGATMAAEKASWLMDVGRVEVQ